jgi:hypothetical protein
MVKALRCQWLANRRSFYQDRGVDDHIRSGICRSWGSIQVPLLKIFERLLGEFLKPSGSASNPVASLPVGEGHFRSETAGHDMPPASASNPDERGPAR